MRSFPCSPPRLTGRTNAYFQVHVTICGVAILAENQTAISFVSLGAEFLPWQLESCQSNE